MICGEGHDGGDLLFLIRGCEVPLGDGRRLILSDCLDLFAEGIEVELRLLRHGFLSRRKGFVYVDCIRTNFGTNV